MAEGDIPKKESLPRYPKFYVGISDTTFKTELMVWQGGSVLSGHHPTVLGFRMPKTNLGKSTDNIIPITDIDDGVIEI